MSPIFHSDWDFRPDELDEEHSRPHVLTVASKDDPTNPASVQYLAANYNVDSGGYLSIMCYVGRILR